MGNRAVITTRSKQLGVYLHWNGGRDSIEAFLKYCELHSFSSPEKDIYGWARLCQVIGNFFGGSVSLGIGDYHTLDTDNYDNGVYIIENWQIVGREFKRYPEQTDHSLDLMLKAIDKKQPKHMQLGDFLDSEEVDVKDLKFGDKVFIQTYDGYEKFEVFGAMAEDKIVNGTNVKGIPYVNRYENDEGEYTENINNYIRTKTIRRLVDED